MTRAHRIGLLLLVGLALFLLVNPERVTGLRGVAWTVLARIEQPVEAAGGGPSSTELKLREEIRALRKVLVHREEALLRERQAVRELQKFREAMSTEQRWPLLPASVLHRSDPRSGERKVLLSRGERDGVARGMPVVRGRSLVGVVHVVHPTTCVVALLSDPDCRVRTFLRSDPPPAESGQKPEEPVGRHIGVAVGTAEGVAIKMIESEQAPAQGDLVFTSGFDDRVPTGLLIGRVASVTRHAHAYQVPVEVTPSQDLGNLDQVHVLCRPPQKLDPQKTTGPRPSGK